MRLLLLLYILPCFASCQPSTEKKVEVSKLSQTQSMIIVSRFKHKITGAPLIELGMGIVINGKYFATCNHLVNKEQVGYKLISCYMIHNERFIDGIYKYDSIKLLRDFRPTENQYNFSTHAYNEQDRKTDFVVLKLEKKLKPLNHTFSNIAPKFQDTVWVRGNFESNNIFYTRVDSSRILMNYTQSNDSIPIFYGYMNASTGGFSGSPVYNSKAEIIGMVQFSFDSINVELAKQVQNGTMSQELFRSIVEWYNEGYRLQFAIDYQYLLNTYLSGYLN